MTMSQQRETTPGFWVGKTIVDVCQALGKPDLVQPAAYFGVKLRDATPSVALTYHDQGCRWFLSEEGIVQAVIRIKE